MAQRMPLAAHIHTSMLCSLVCLTTPSSLCPWVGWGPQRYLGPAWPLQAPPEFPPSTDRDVTGPAPTAAGVCPSPGSRAQGGPRQENQEPSAPRHPTHLRHPGHASPQPTCCAPATHGSSKGKQTGIPVWAAALARGATIFCRPHSGGNSPVDPWFYIFQTGLYIFHFFESQTQHDYGLQLQKFLCLCQLLRHCGKSIGGIISWQNSCFQTFGIQHI